MGSNFRKKLKIDTNSEKDRAFQLIVGAGQVLLENGAEIHAVESAMDQMAACLEIETMANYVIANGIFATAEGSKSPLRSAIKQAAPGNTNLKKIDAINTLVLDLKNNEYTLEEAELKLHEIENMGSYPTYITILAYIFGAGFFCYALGGSLADSLVSGFAGFFLGCFFMVSSHWNNAKALKIMLGSVIVSLICCFAFKAGFGDTLNRMIVGSVIPMIPGVPFTNSIRDFVENDYLSGLIRLSDVLLVMVSIAVGVAIVYTLPIV